MSDRRPGQWVLAGLGLLLLLAAVRLGTGTAVFLQTPGLVVDFVGDRLSAIPVALVGIVVIAGALGGAGVGAHRRDAVAVAGMVLGALVVTLAGAIIVAAIALQVVVVSVLVTGGLGTRWRFVGLLGVEGGLAAFVAGSLLWFGPIGPSSEPTTLEACLLAAGAIAAAAGGGLLAGFGGRTAAGALATAILPALPAYMLVRVLSPFAAAPLALESIAVGASIIVAAGGLLARRSASVAGALGATGMAHGAMATGLLVAGLLLNQAQAGSSAAPVLAAVMGLVLTQGLARAAVHLGGLDLDSPFWLRLASLGGICGLPPAGTLAALVAAIAAMLTVAASGGLQTGAPMVASLALTAVGLGALIDRWGSLLRPQAGAAPRDPAESGARAGVITLVAVNGVVGIIPGLVWMVIPSGGRGMLDLTTTVGTFQPLVMYVFGLVIVGILVGLSGGRASAPTSG